ncbi:Calcium-transporting ATPase 3 [Escovopsis weberi]|uniref:P-type Na(+) transporter n=1 Tax=Escovopsis weberi TaxID=150374 RepID=A0A0M8N2Q1_ESCWE|nr:Calcium-transporting ATPase 3 [Escovopsis weberi]
MNWRKYGKRQSVVGLSKRTYDAIGKFLGLTEGTPLQRKLSALAYILFGCAIVLAIIVFAVNEFNLRHEVIIYATSLGIAIIPESLVAVLTITMVVAVTVMRKANVVVRDLSALEALGGVTNICSDKTGTLTEGSMIVRQINEVPGASQEEKEEHEKEQHEKGESPSGLRFEIPEEHAEKLKSKSDEVKESVLLQMNSLASQGQRVLAVAYRSWEGKFTAKQSLSPETEEALRASVEQGLTLLGLAGIHDPPRCETKLSIAECSAAGIKVHMLTGDHPETARAIAKEVGIIPKNPGILPENVAASVVQKATDFDRMDDSEIDALEELPLVIARCAPDTKTRMIEALRRRGAFMAMTGDGVNDAPSLSRADVGIAMGSGSDVAKSEAKIVLTDDKFNSIVAAIRQGRRMFDNIQKFVLHLLASNVGEVILLVAGLAFVDESGFSVFPVSPLQIIWINMVTSSFPAFGLGREAAAPDVMRKPPHSKQRGIFTNQIIVDVLVYGVLMGACTMGTFCIIIYGANGGDLGKDCNTRFSEECRAVFRARAATFAELTWLILVSAWEFKSLRRSMFRLNPEDTSSFPFFKDVYSNRFLFWSVVLGGLTVFPVVYLPFLNTRFFKHTGISWEWAVSVGFTIVFITGVELWKLAKRKFDWLDDGSVRKGYWDQGASDDLPPCRRTWSFSSLRTLASFSWKEAAETTMRRWWGQE